MNMQPCTPRSFRIEQVTDPELEMTSSRLMDLLCQISLVLLMFFIMMNVMFQAKSKVEMAEAKGTLAHYRDIIEDIRSTDVGTLYEEKENVLIELQKQKLLRALDEVERQDRKLIGLTTFSKATLDGTQELDTRGIVTRRTIADHRFVDGCAFAKEHIPFQEAMAEDWELRALIFTGLKTDDESRLLITQHPEIVTKENEIWLKREIVERLQAVKADAISLQRAVLAEILDHFRENTNELRGTAVYTYISEYSTASPDRQGELINVVNTELVELAKAVLTKQQVALLTDV